MYEFEDCNFYAQHSFTISCFTKNEGKKYLEAWPNSNSVKPSDRSEKDDKFVQDQVWTLYGSNSVGYFITCNTVNKGVLVLEVSSNGTVVLAPQDMGKPGQRWRIVDNGTHQKIYSDCELGRVYLEAWPRGKKIKATPISLGNVDQCWSFNIYDEFTYDDNEHKLVFCTRPDATPGEPNNVLDV